MRGFAGAHERNALVKTDRVTASASENDADSRVVDEWKISPRK